jgi:hypothetical protein
MMNASNPLRLIRYSTFGEVLTSNKSQINKHCNQPLTEYI